MNVGEWRQVAANLWQTLGCESAPRLQLSAFTISLLADTC